tara:strand:+ start:114 stop:593 length:480 start_codon:yes stop_codon:yes gene_type:complete
MILNKENNYFKKKAIKFKERIDFNYISAMLNAGNYPTSPSSRWLTEYIFDSVFEIKGVHKHKPLKDLFQFLNKNFNTKKLKTDMNLFMSYVSGCKSNTHRDKYDVWIIGCLGRTLYKIEDREYTVERGDILHIPTQHLHVAIGLEPRIVLSYATRGDLI